MKTMPFLIVNDWLPRSTKAYLVDLDNTIYNQDLYDYAVMRKSVTEFNTVFASYSINQELFDQILGARTRDRCTRNLFDSILSQHGFCRRGIQLFVSLYQAAATNVDVVLPAYQGCFRCLEAIRQNSSRIILVTNGKRKTQLNKLKCLGVGNLFDNILILDGTDGRDLKPSHKCVIPYILNEEAVLFAEHIAVIGDDLATDMGLAQAIGCKYYHPSQLWNTT